MISTWWFSYKQSKYKIRNLNSRSKQTKTKLRWFYHVLLHHSLLTFTTMILLIHLIQVQRKENSSTESLDGIPSRPIYLNWWIEIPFRMICIEKPWKSTQIRNHTWNWRKLNSAIESKKDSILLPNLTFHLNKTAIIEPSVTGTWKRDA